MSRPAAGRWPCRSFASWPRPRRRSTGCRSRRSTSTRSGRSTASPTSPARPSRSICSSVERITCRSVPPGSGTVKCAHGLMPVPAPGDRRLLKGMPLAKAPVTGELVDADRGRDPGDRRERVHRPAGHDGRAHRLRGRPEGLHRAAEHARVSSSGRSTPWRPANDGHGDGPGDEPRRRARRSDWLLFRAAVRRRGAGRVHGPDPDEEEPAGRAADRDRRARDRRRRWKRSCSARRGRSAFGGTRRRRSKLDREAITVATPWGQVQAKRGWRGELEVVTPEYEDCARVARENDVPLREVYRRGQGVAVERPGPYGPGLAYSADDRVRELPSCPPCRPGRGSDTFRSVSTVSIARMIRPAVCVSPRSLSISTAGRISGSGLARSSPIASRVRPEDRLRRRGRRPRAGCRPCWRSRRTGRPPDR